MTTIDIDGLSEEEFRRSIESRLRQGLAAKAVEKLRAQLAPFAGPGGILPERFLTISADDLTLGGWDALSDALRRHDRPGRPVTALSIAFGWPGEEVPQPDDQGRLSPLIETGFYTDDAFPFSKSSREDLLEGYSYHGCTWTGDCEAADTSLWLTGIDDLHGALALLEARLLASDEPDEEGIRAGSLGACLLSALLFQAVETRIVQGGLPRPLCVMAGSNGVYPYFDAPVAGFPEEARKAAELADDDVSALDAGVPGPRYSSLLVTGIPRAKKRAVLVLAETADEEAMRIARLRGINHPEVPVPEVPLEPPLRSDGTIASAPESPLMVKKPSGQSWDFRDMLSTYEPEAESIEAEAFEPEQDWDEAAPIEPEQDWGGGLPSGPEPRWGNPEPLEPEVDRGSDPLSDPEPDWSDPSPLELTHDLAEPEPPEPDDDWLDVALPEQDDVPAPAAPVSSDEPAVGPGFSLLDVLREDRSRPLFPLPDFHAEEAEAEPDPVAFSAEALADEPADFAAMNLEQPGEPESTEVILSEPEEFMASVPPPPTWPPEPNWLREAEARILPKSAPSTPVSRQPAIVEQAVAKSLLTRLRDWWYGRR